MKRTYQWIATLAVATVGCALVQADTAQPEDATPTEACVAQTAPTLELPARGGGTVDLARYRGKVVIVDFWASWCAPCKKELPELQRLYEQYGERGLVVVGVDIDDDPKAGDALASRLKLTFPIGFDSNQRVAEAWGPPKMPTSYVIDRQGNVVAVQAGFEPSDAAKLEALVQEQLK